MQNHQPNQEGELLYLFAQDCITRSLYGADYGKTRVGWTGVFKVARHSFAVLSQENVWKNAQIGNVQPSQKVEIAEPASQFTAKTSSTY